MVTTGLVSTNQTSMKTSSTSTSARLSSSQMEAIAEKSTKMGCKIRMRVGHEGENHLRTLLLQKKNWIASSLMQAGMGSVKYIRT